ncbi:MAG: hypothetical protein GZ091_00895 [Paludibacter sp.]|nr:hypothetical protein [Paludibacter sp.]
MKKIFLLFLFGALIPSVVGQINSEDSTAQIIGYWDKNEKQTYTITENSYQITNATDTTKRQLYSYNVDVEVIDSSANSYTLKWLYKNFNIKETWNPAMEKLISISNNLPVIIKTDEYGTFQEVVNWEEGRDFIKKGVDLLRNDYKAIPNFNIFLDQLVSLFSTKEAIENSAIEEVQQFYAFHGVKYKLGEEINAKIKLPNNYGGEPFDADLTAELDQINEEDDNVIIRLWQTANSKQVTDAAYEFVKSMQKTLGGTQINREEFPLSNNEVRTASSIDGSSGWVIYSIQTKEVSANNILQINERTIELQ